MMNAKQAFEFLREKITDRRVMFRIECNCEQRYAMPNESRRPDDSEIWMRITIGLRSGGSADFYVGGNHALIGSEITEGLKVREEQIDAEDFEPAARAALDWARNQLIAEEGTKGQRNEGTESIEHCVARQLGLPLCAARDLGYTPLAEKLRLPSQAEAMGGGGGQ